jgi:hypothetical protein
MARFRQGRTPRATVLGLLLAGSLGLAAPAPAAAARVARHVSRHHFRPRCRPAGPRR